MKVMVSILSKGGDKMDLSRIVKKQCDGCIHEAVCGGRKDTVKELHESIEPLLMRTGASVGSRKDMYDLINNMRARGISVAILCDQHKEDY